MIIRELLNSWGMPEEVISRFIEEEIDEIVLKNINKTIIESLIPKLGHRIKFYLKWKEWLESYSLIIEQEETDQFVTLITDENNTIDQTNNTIDQNNTKDESSNTKIIADLNLPVIDTANKIKIISTHTDTSDKTVEKYDLTRILSESTRGKEVLSFYKQNGRLTDRLRNYVADCILSAELSTDVDKRITINRLTFLAETIIELFPNEHMIIWVQKYKVNNNTISKGKLLHRYYNIRRSLIKSGLINKYNSKSEALPVENIEEQYSQDIKDHLEWLRHNMQPWSRVVCSWEITLKARIEQLKICERGKNRKRPNIHDYTIQYPALNTPTGYSLFEIDFEKQYPGSILKLYGEWPKLYNFILKKLQNDSIILHEQFTIENDTVPVLMLLSRLFPVNTAIKQKGVGQWRPSRQEIAEGFILHVKIPGDIQPSLDIRRKKFFKFGLTLQPLTIIVGPTLKEIHQNIVVVDDVLYEVETTLKAIDVTFKAFHALHASYPVECERIWLFLQKAIYNIETQWDKQEGTVTSLVKEYNDES